MKNSRIKKVAILAFVYFFLITFIKPVAYSEPTEKFDIVIKGGDIYNPSTEHRLSGYNLGIKDGKIERITKADIEGKEIIDATGLVVSPGFIDLISYDPNDIGIKFKILDGVTSNLAMHGGTEDAKTWYSRWEKRGLPINFGASTFITRLRWPIVGYGVDATMTKESDIKKLVASARKNIEEGALGISFSFEYVPGIQEQEVIPLLKLAKEYDVPTFYHLRSSDTSQPDKQLEGVQEVIDYGRETGAAIHIMHINSTGGTYVMEEALKMVHDAIDEGLDVTTCIYPYDYWATYIDSARFRPGWQDRFRITYSDLQVGGTDERLTEETFNHYRATTHYLVAAHGSMPEEEITMALKDPIVMIGSDTIIEPSLNNHPRGAGNYSRLFGKYVREEKVLTMMEAIKKASYLPAKRMESAAPSMKVKGRIEIGADADITIFNPDTIIDKSTVKSPDTPSEGIEYVIVNGVIIKNKDGIIKNVKPGKAIKSYFIDKTLENKPIDLFTMTIDEDIKSSLSDAYNIDGDTYVPLNKFFDTIGKKVIDNNNGDIEIDNILLQLGTNTAKVNSSDISLEKEPIIYKGNTYIYQGDLQALLKDEYDITLKDSEIHIKTLSLGQGKNENESDKIDKEVESISEKKPSIISIIITIILAVGIILAALTISKNKSGKQ